MTSAVPPAPPTQPPAGAWEPPLPPDPPARPALHRSRTDRVLGGVAGGLADYTGIDALLWRVGLVALTFAGGTGILVYLLLWVLMPAGPAVPGAAVARRKAAGPRSPVPRLTMAALLIVVGVLVLVTRLTGWDLAPAAFFGTALLIVGLGLVAAAFSTGRTARGGLIALGVVLSFGLLVSSTEPWEHADGDFDERTIRPQSAEEVPPVYDLDIGDVKLDLTALDLSGLDAPVTTRLDAGVGDVDIVVPPSADVRVQVDRGLGDVEIFGDEDSVSGYYRGSGPAAWTGDGDPEIVLTVNAGLGDVEVSRA